MESILLADLCHSKILAELHQGRAGDAFYKAAKGVLGKSCMYPSDGVVMSIWPSVSEAIDAALKLQDAMIGVNSALNLAIPLFLRIAIHGATTGARLAPPLTPEHAEVARVQRLLTETCPTGRIVLSRQAHAGIHGNCLGDLFRPTQLGDHFVQKTRPLMPQERGLAKHLDDNQRRALPALCFPSWDLVKPGLTLVDLPKILDQDLAIVFGDSANQRGILHSAATSDTVGLTECARLARGGLAVGIDEWDDTADLVTRGTTLVVGSGIVNMYAHAMNSVFPIGFDSGENGRIHAEIIVRDAQHGPTYYGRHAYGHNSIHHCGVVIVSKSIFNLDKTLVWIAGTTGMGTQAASVLLRDLLNGNVVEGLDRKAVGCVVTPKVPAGQVGEYFRRWRIWEYRILHTIDADANTLYSQ